MTIVIEISELQGFFNQQTLIKRPIALRDYRQMNHLLLGLRLIVHPNSYSLILPLGFPGGSDGKVCACNAGDPGLIPGSGRSPREGYGNPLQYSCLENPVVRGAWQRAVLHRVRHEQ